MCHFITLVVPSIDTVSITRILRAHGRHPVQSKNLRLKSLLAPGDCQFLTRSTGCDCGTALVHYETAPDDPFWQEKETAKLHRKGWSPTKIERFLVQKTEVKAKSARTASERIDSLELWRDIIRDLQEQLELDQVGIHVHNYSGGIEEKDLSPIVRYASPTETALDSLNSIKDDELLIFRKVKK